MSIKEIYHFLMFVLLTVSGVDRWLLPKDHLQVRSRDDLAISTPEIYRVIGQRVRAERHKRKLTQDELAEMAQLTRTSITNIERGRQKLLLHTLFAFAAAFEIEAKELLADICLPRHRAIKKNLPRNF